MATIKNPGFPVRPDNRVTTDAPADGNEYVRKDGAWEVATGGGGDVDWTDVTGKPSTFTPSAHTHVIADTTGLQSALDGKQAVGSYASATHSHAIADVTGLQTALDGKAALGASASHLWMAPAAGEFIGNGLNATALGTQAQVANRNIIGPFRPAYSVTIDQLGVSVSTFAAGTTVKCVIYASDANGRPATILRESATISSDTPNATRFVSITSITLTAGTLYWVGLRSSGTATVRTLGVGSAANLTYTNAATPLIESALVVTETYANAAANWTYAASQHSNALVPLILMRVA